MKKSLKVAGLTLALASSALFASVANAEENIAFINSAYIFQNAPERQAALKKLDEEFKAPVEQLRAKEQAIVDKIQKLQKDGKNLRQADIKKREDEINKLRADYDKEANELQQKINQRRSEEDNKVVESIQKVVNEIAKEKKYTFVIDANAVAFAVDGKNITKDVMDKLAPAAQPAKK
ncbi:OmpH family outer membrane protein [Gallibacterium sp. AGMB14963]|uniref:OmpH family outer membrane protein n=1 Tax=Gallibacterium faecale TaxID=3019086 RepID=UPI0022F16797|nr:OmpH family outer membrane protein [Gallibacterium sp. AGMB14963]MDA3979138.1 OmpH family outer membrane protein [Gallibacterium sp. AGMB14963]